MTQQLPPDKEQELLKIVELAQVTEQKLKKMSNFATQMVEKHESWYRAESKK